MSKTEIAEKGGSRTGPRIVLTGRQIVGLPVMLGVMIAALGGAFGDDRAQVTLRIILVYIFVLVGFRVIGKRELSQMTPFEMVTLFLIPQLFRNTILRNDNTLETALVGATVLFALVFISSLLTFRFRPLRVLFQATPTVLVRNGLMLDRDCNRERITREDLESAAHRAGLADLAEVQWAILESDGQIAVVPYPTREQPLPVTTTAN